LAAELEGAQRRLDETLEAEGRRREAEIAEAARQEAEAYERVPTSRIAAVARALAKRVVTGEGP